MRPGAALTTVSLSLFLRTCPAPAGVLEPFTLGRWPARSSAVRARVQSPGRVRARAPVEGEGERQRGEPNRSGPHRPALPLPARRPCRHLIRKLIYGSIAGQGEEAGGVCVGRKQCVRPAGAGLQGGERGREERSTAGGVPGPHPPRRKSARVLKCALFRYLHTCDHARARTASSSLVHPLCRRASSAPVLHDSSRVAP